ncbi:hypothetical protein [Noviherbaspirillum humi]|nr:hypothetical protein [Noviherbaspirillum humi]
MRTKAASPTSKAGTAFVARPVAIPTAALAAVGDNDDWEEF